MSMNFMPFQGFGLGLTCSARTITEPRILQPQRLSTGSSLEMTTPDELGFVSKATEWALALPGSSPAAAPDHPLSALVLSKSV
jgi:hypothetical protein